MSQILPPVEIPLSKSKIVLLLLGSLVFVALGFWLVLSPPVTENFFFKTPGIMKMVGYAAITFFGICAFFFVRKLGDNKPGIIMDSEGLTDNSSGVSGGFILWKDMEEIAVKLVSGQKLIMIRVKNPQDYIDRQTGAFKRKLMELNYSMYGTPLSITANGLEISFEELMKMIEERWQASRKSNHAH